MYPSREELLEKIKEASKQAMAPGNIPWEEAERTIRLAGASILEMDGEYEEARLVRARHAMWEACTRAVNAGKKSCTEDALKAWKEVMNG